MMYFIGGFMLIMGIFLLVIAARKRAAAAPWVICFGLDFGLTGLAVIIFKFGSVHGFPAYFPNDFSGRALAMGIGLLCYITFLMDTWRMFTCKKKVTAEYTGFRCMHNYRIMDTYVPSFSYVWEGQGYQDIESDYALSKRKIKKYQKGNRYGIYINPHYPQIIMADRRLAVGDVLLLFYGTVFVIGSCL